MASRISAPPILISAVPYGVVQLTMGRPAAFAVALGLPGSLSRTKRFMSSVRAAMVRRENDCAFRAVRNLVNATSSCEQAAESVSRRESVGTAIGGAGSVTDLE